MEREYFEDCHIGDHLVTQGRTITEADIVMFAAFSGDWNPIHTDKEFAKAGVFGERIAHGLLTFVVGVGLLFRRAEKNILPKSVLAFVGIEKIRFIAPVKISDTVYLEIEIIEMIKMRKQRGILVLRCRIKNQQDQTVIKGRIRLMVACRPPEGTPG
jgi:acyl dehydratase